MRWAAFEGAAAELAQLARDAFEEEHLCIVGTLRADGWPRLSPNEVYLVDGELLLGMMPRSRKSRDLERDPRITVVNGQALRVPRRGDVKLYGTARPVRDPLLRKAIGVAQEAAIGWRPPEPFPLWAVDLERAAYISFGEGRRLMRWSARGGLERLPHPED